MPPFTDRELLEREYEATKLEYEAVRESALESRNEARREEARAQTLAIRVSELKQRLELQVGL